MPWTLDEEPIINLGIGGYTLMLQQKQLDDLRALRGRADILDKMREIAQQAPKGRQKFDVALMDGRSAAEHADEIWGALHPPAGAENDDED